MLRRVLHAADVGQHAALGGQLGVLLGEHARQRVALLRRRVRLGPQARDEQRRVLVASAAHALGLGVDREALQRPMGDVDPVLDRGLQRQAARDRRDVEAGGRGPARGDDDVVEEDEAGDLGPAERADRRLQVLGGVADHDPRDERRRDGERERPLPVDQDARRRRIGGDDEVAEAEVVEAGEQAALDPAPAGSVARIEDRPEAGVVAGVGVDRGQLGDEVEDGVDLRLGRREAALVQAALDAGQRGLARDVLDDQLALADLQQRRQADDRLRGGQPRVALGEALGEVRGRLCARRDALDDLQRRAVVDDQRLGPVLTPAQEVRAVAQDGQAATSTTKELAKELMIPSSSSARATSCSFMSGRRGRCHGIRWPSSAADGASRASASSCRTCRGSL